MKRTAPGNPLAWGEAERIQRALAREGVVRAETVLNEEKQAWVTRMWGADGNVVGEEVILQITREDADDFSI